MDFKWLGGRIDLRSTESKESGRDYVDDIGGIRLHPKDPESEALQPGTCSEKSDSQTEWDI